MPGQSLEIPSDITRTSLAMWWAPLPLEPSTSSPSTCCPSGAKNSFFRSLPSQQTKCFSLLITMHIMHATMACAFFHLANEWMNESALILSTFENQLRACFVWHTMQTNPAVEQNKKINGPRVHGISLVGQEKVYWGKDLPKRNEKYIIRVL